MSSSAIPPLAIIVGLLGLLAIVTAVRHAVPRRLALRSIARRPGETVLVILGSLLGTAIITGSFIVGDTLDNSIRVGAETQLGPIDETVTAFGTESLPVLREALARLEDEPEVDGVTFAVRAAGTAATRLDGDTAVRPSVLVLELDLEEGRGFGGDPAATGLEGVATPAEGEAVISEDLAKDLAIEAGDDITLFAYGSERELQVADLVPRLGLAGYSTEFRAESFNVFLAPGTLDELVDAAPPDLEASPPTALAFVSNEGGVFEGEELTDEVVPLIRERIADLEGVDVVDSKRDVVVSADRQGRQFSELFLSVGSFAVIAGILLLVNIFVMLSEERKGELGMMRAVGMRRGQLVRSFYIEGSLYALVASAVGALAGIGVGAAIVRVAADIFAGGSSDFSLELVFTASLVSILGGFLIGLLISLLTALLTSARISRLNIIRAIRDIPEPPPQRRRVRPLLLGAVAVLVGGAMTASAIDRGDAASAFAGPGILALGLGALLSRVLPRRPLGSLLALAVLGWGIFGPTLAPDVFGEAATPVFVIQGVLLTAAAVAVLAFNQETVGRGVRAVAGGGRNLAARLGLAYPLAKRFRTVMTLSMYALVVFTLVFISVLSNIFGGQVEDFTEQEAGGYQLLVRSSAANPLGPEEAESEDGVEAVAPLRYAAFSVEFSTESAPEPEPWALSGIDERFLATTPPALEKWVPEYESQGEAWEAVVTDPTLIILDGFFLQQGGPEEPAADLRDTVRIRDPLTGVEVERTVIGVTRGGFSFSGPFVSQESIIELMGPRAVATRLYVALEPDAEAAEVAARLQEEHIPNGVEARTFRAIVSESQAANLQFFRLMQGYLALGLVVGISGLGVIMVRAVRERRREIGILRSLGFQSRTVGRSFLLESGFVAIEGLVVGAVLAIVTAYQLVTNAEVFGDLEVTFVVPWAEILILLGITLVASLLATGWPARQAGRIRPAVALRVAD